MEIVVGIASIVASIGIYLAGRLHGEKLGRKRQAHERSLEETRRLRELCSRAADEYVKMARSNLDLAPHALASLSLELPGSDKLIRESIQEMHLRSGHNLWGNQSGEVEDIDLVSFFTYVKKNNVDFFKTSVKKAAKAVRESGGLRKSHAT